MRSKKEIFSSSLCGLLASVVTLSAEAQTPAQAPAWYPEPYPAHVSIQAAPSTQLEVVAAGAPIGSPAITRCTEYCDFWALPGKYTLYARDYTGQLHDLPLRIKQSSRYVFEPGDDDARMTGLGLGIGGSVAIMTGFVLMIPAIMSQACEDTNCTSDGERSAATAGAVVLLTGLVTAPIGWGMFAHNRTRLKRADHAGYRPRENTSSVRLGLVGVGLGGLGLGGIATF